MSHEIISTMLMENAKTAISAAEAMYGNPHAHFLRRFIAMKGVLEAAGCFAADGKEKFNEKVLMAIDTQDTIATLLSSDDPSKALGALMSKIGNFANVNQGIIDGEKMRLEEENKKKEAGRTPLPLKLPTKVELPNIREPADHNA